MNIALNGKAYWAIIEGKDIILQGITEDVIFEGGYDLLKEEAEDEFYSVEFAGMRLSEFISEYVLRRLETFIMFNKELGHEVNHNLN